MTKRNIIPKWPLAAVAALALVAASAYASGAAGLVDFPFGPSSKPLPPDRYYGVGDSVTRGGVTITLEEVGYTSSETILEFLVSGFSDNIAGPVDSIILHQGSFQYTGLEVVTPRVVSARLAEDETSSEISLGPVTQLGAEITFEIGQIAILGSGGESAIIHGPWGFRFTAPLSAADPVNLDLPIGVKKASGGQEVTLQRVHISSSGTQVFYHLEAAPDSLGAANAPARLLSPDGSWAFGSATRRPSAGDGELQVDFSATSTNADATISFGPYLRRLAGPFSFDLLLPQTPSTLPVTLPLGHNFVVAGETIQAVELRLEEDRTFGLLFANVNEGHRTVVRDPTVEADLVDDRGNEYTTISVDWHYSDDQNGASVADTLFISFREPLDPDATSLRLEVPSLARLEYGPGFVVLLPPVPNP